MDRLISEQAVIDVINGCLINRQTVIDKIKAIPSAEYETEITKYSDDEKCKALITLYFDSINCEDKEKRKRYNTAIKLIESIPSAESKWIPVSERLPEEDGDYFVTYEKGYAEDYDLTPIGIARFEVDCESFGYWHEHFDRQTLGSLGSEWEEIKVIAWMPLPPSYEPQESEVEKG